MVGGVTEAATGTAAGREQAFRELPSEERIPGPEFPLWRLVLEALDPSSWTVSSLLTLSPFLPSLHPLLPSFHPLLPSLHPLLPSLYPPSALPLPPSSPPTPFCPLYTPSCPPFTPLSSLSSLSLLPN